MVQKLKRRYLITNMALLSGTFLVGLTVLFVLLYHSEVQHSYDTMQSLLEDTTFEAQNVPTNAPMAHTESDADALILWETSPAMTETTVETSSSTEIVLSMPGWGVPAHTDEIECIPEMECDRRYRDDYEVPPYWLFWDDTYSEEWMNSEEGYEETWESDKNNDDSDDASEEDGRKDWEDRWEEGHNPPPPPPEFSEPWQTTVTTSTTQKPPSTQTTTTTVKTNSDTFVSTQSEAQSAVLVITTTSGSTTTASTTTTTIENTFKDEGRYVPEALIAQFDDKGNLYAYTGSGAYENSDMQDVNRAMEVIRHEGKNSGTLKLDDVPYRYLYQPDELGRFHLVLLNRNLELTTISRMAFLFLAFTLLGLLCMFALSNLLANWTVAPVMLAWEKQKQFVADASHELKTPLTVISANTEVILSNPGSLVSGQKKWLDYIQSETMRMSKLISNLLTCARMEHKQTDAVPQDRLHLSDLASNVCLVFEPIVYEHHKTLNTIIQRNVYYRADEDNMKQLLSILLDNAALHSSENAEITVSLSQDAQGKIRLAVSNTAQDIPPEQLSRLFDRFYRLDTKGSPQGSGLGLSIAKGIVHDLKGALTVTSENQLVTFVATLPN